jgi:hypothetical protein
MWHTVRILVIVATVALAGCTELLLERQPDASPAPAEVFAAARKGDAGAAFLAYRQASTAAERRRWICIAANRDLPEAQAEIAELHWPRPWTGPSIFGTDTYKAYVWTIIAMRNRRPVEHMKIRLSMVLPEDARRRATAQADAWRPDVSQCVNMEDSEYFRIAPAAGADASS